MKKTVFKIAGVMTGTSCDGLDVACAEFSGDAWKPLWTKSAPYPAGLRKRVLAAQLPGAKLSLKEWGELHRDIGSWYGAALKKALHGAQSVDAIGCHGQTVAHFPAPRRQGFTIQLGDATRIAHETGLTVISNFRDGDMAGGGEGAPLAPRFHRLLANSLRQKGDGVAIHNLGGIGNLSYFGPGGKVIAFDTGPANLWIDAAAELVTKGRAKFDRGGKLAARREPDRKAIDRILRNPFFEKQPPKSTGRDDFPFAKLLEVTAARDESLIATATFVTLESIAGAYEQFILRRGLPLKAIYFCGGGSKNNFLLGVLRKRMSGVKISTLEEVGYDSSYIEAQAFAYFGYLALLGKPLGGEWTGASERAPSAHITPGANWPGIVQKLARARF